MGNLPPPDRQKLASARLAIKEGNLVECRRLLGDMIAARHGGGIALSPKPTLEQMRSWLLRNDFPAKTPVEKAWVCIETLWRHLGVEGYPVSAPDAFLRSAEQHLDGTFPENAVEEFEANMRRLAKDRGLDWPNEDE